MLNNSIYNINTLDIIENNPLYISQISFNKYIYLKNNKTIKNISIILDPSLVTNLILNKLTNSNKIKKYKKPILLKVSIVDSTPLKDNIKYYIKEYIYFLNFSISILLNIALLVNFNIILGMP